VRWRNTPKARVVILALGSRGDVEPCIALALGLQNEGHETVILALDDFRNTITSAGIGFASAGASLPEPQQASKHLDWALAHAYRHQLIAVGGTHLWLRSIAPSVAHAMLRLIRPSDVIISGILTLDGAFALHTALGCRLAIALFAPCLPTRHGASLIEPAIPQADTTLNRWAGSISWSIGVRWSRPSGAIIRRAMRQPRQGAKRAFTSTEKVPLLLAVSTLLVPSAPDWPSPVRFTGPWITRQPVEWEPPHDLRAFLSTRPVPIYVGFGSVGHPNDLHLLIDAARVAGVSIVTNKPRGSKTKSGPLTPELFVASDLPHLWLFRQLAGVIHHGSAGTTMTALHAGVPSTASPHQFDQSYYARRLSQLRVGPTAVPRRQLNRDRLVGLMKGLTCPGAGYPEQAQIIMMRAVLEDGVAQAVRVLHSEDVL